MSGLVEFTRRYRFSASHRLHVETLSLTQNQQTFGKCNNPFGHGHNYTLGVTVRGPVDAETGMVMNMVKLDTLVDACILQRFDVQNLNHDPLFQDEVSSTENLSRAVWRVLHAEAGGTGFGTARLWRVRIEETSNNFFEYGGEDSGQTVNDAAAEAGKEKQTWH